jgi:ATP-dependent helicase/nuclease subunit B
VTLYGAPIFAGAGPRWFTIQAHRPFLEDLAETLHATLAADGPEALADAVVLTPTRRGARALAQAFLKTTGGGALLLPQILALGDLDEGEPPFEPGDLALDLPPAITPGQRRFELARLVSDHAHLFERSLDALSALELGEALGAFLDSVQIEEIDPAGKLDGLVDEDMAAHWRRSADVLRLAVDLWPRRLRELGLLDVNQRRTALLRALAEQWTANPPDRPLIAAGSTGTAPATADLLAVIAASPKGLVVLPGLDRDLADEAWDEVGEAHPQGAMKRLLMRAGLDRAAVKVWPASESAVAVLKGRSRRRVINEALRPPDATGDWLRVIGDLKAEGEGAGADPIAEGLDGLSAVNARNEEEAATLAALLLRESLERPGETAALITPDQAMARRVSARLARWGVEADSSAGRPLANYPAGVLMSLIARAAAGGLDPATTLAILKHPLARFGADEATLAAGRGALERYGLRGPKPRDWPMVARRLDEARARNRAAETPSPDRETNLNSAERLSASLQSAIAVASAPFAAGGASLPVAARALAAALEAFARDEHGAVGDLWSGAGGEAAAACIAGLIEDGAPLAALTPRAFADLIETTLAQHPVRTGGANHPRLRILGALEARLVRADRLILAGLEEGVWPRVPPTDPFLSRPMRAKLGLPPPERRIGLSAHDFAQAACAPEVILISTERREGQPAVKSRWLWRLETLIRGAGLAIPRRREVEAWARALDAPLDPAPPALAPAKRPEPRPPLEARPRKMPVTRVETWVRDPYAVYARDILGLRLLDRPDADTDAARRGTAIHRAFQIYAERHAAPPPEDAVALFAALVVEALDEAGFSQAALARERTLAARLGCWATAFEAERRAFLQDILVETEGAHAFEVQGRPFTLTAKADRIELSTDGRAHVLDFKTGQAPTPPQVASGLSPQLTLTAAILMRGGFERLGQPLPGELLYVRAIGRRVAGEVKSAVHKDQTALDLAEAAMEGLIRRIARFDDPETPYLAWTAPQFLAQRGGDFDHLSRLYEWHVMGDGGDGEGGE